MSYTIKIRAFLGACSLILSTFTAQSQHTHTPGRTCYANDKLQEQLLADPALEQQMRLVEDMTQRYINEHGNSRAAQTRTIPVYVHVLWRTSQENISDAQIQSQIAVLNQDYGGTNADISGVPSAFTSVTSTGTGIQFTLAGITRKQTTKTSWGTNDDMKKLSMGGVNPITPSTHMNMWICNIGGGILGYAQFPGGSSTTDGVVFSPQYCGSSALGSNFYLSAPFNKGRTATHEVGHYLNLRHIWGDGGCSADDLVNDTPLSDQANYGCPSYPTVHCSTSDMYMNYMDYVDDNCMFMFSKGQETRMWACLNTSRAQLGTSTGTGSGTGTGGGPTTTCTTNEVMLTLNFDNYASETSWQLKNSSGTVLYSGSGYTDGTASTGKTFCLANGCYDFVINDSYGDGICCSYGSGSYTIKQGSTTLASGATFTTSETKQFCIGSTSGGGGTPTAPVQIYGDYFESSFGNWLDGGTDCARYTGTYSFEGTYSIRLRDNTGTGSAMTSKAFSAVPYNQLTIDFVFYPNSMENTEDFFVQYYNGSAWVTVGTYASGTHFSNGSFYSASITLNKTQYNFPSNAQFRIQCDASDDNDQIYIDKVIITGSTGTARSGGNTITQLGSPIAEDLKAFDDSQDLLEMDLNVFPNPATSVLNVEVLNTTGVCLGRIMDATGRTVWSSELEAGLNQIALGEIATGLYYFSAVQKDGTVVTKKFVKNN